MNYPRSLIRLDRDSMQDHEPLDLRRGDPVCYDATMRHSLISLSDKDATVLWLTSLA